jgi:glycosyltransferase involved in cell wall biosynthesis
MMNSKPNKITFSVIMPTLNSEKTIKDSLEAIRKQKFDQAKVEIIIADGGSADRTREIAASFGAVVVNNPKVTPENGIQVGMLKATGDYWCIIGSDEIWLDKLALQKRLNLFRSDPNVKNIVTAGLLTPDNYPRVSRYINSFGDPFSFFIYRLDGEEYYKSLKSRYNHRENKDGLVLEFKKEDVLPIVDGAQTIDSQFFRSIFPKISPEIIPLVFFNMANQTHKLGVIRETIPFIIQPQKLLPFIKKPVGESKIMFLSQPVQIADSVTEPPEIKK